MECPVCKKRFGGVTAQTRLNSHAKTYHLEFYRETIRPLKSLKAVNRDSYLKQKENDPAKVKKARVMSRLRQKARQMQINRIKRAALPTAPHQPGSPHIDLLNPFYVAGHRLGVFVGVTKADLLAFPLADTLKSHAADIEDIATTIEEAILKLEDLGLERVATSYHLYRKALQAMEDYPETLAHFEKRYHSQEHKQLMPESYVDEELVSADAEELYEHYLKEASFRQKRKEACGSTNEDDIDLGLGLDVNLDNLDLDMSLSLADQLLQLPESQPSGDSVHENDLAQSQHRDEEPVQDNDCLM